MRKLYSAFAVLALGVCLQAVAAPREITFSAQVSNLARDGKPVSSFKTNGNTLVNNSVLAGKISYDLDGPRDVIYQNYHHWPAPQGRRGESDRGLTFVMHPAGKTF